jgi:diguanylate cyclase (GGDEF)-like protein/PAS domain S-box-containing protein
MTIARLTHKTAKLWLRLDLRKKLSFTFVAVAVIPLSLTTAIIGPKGEEVLKRSVFAQNRNLAERIALDIDWMFSEKTRVLKIAAATAEIRSMLPDKQSPVLQTIGEQDPDLQIVIVADTKGKQIARSDNRPVDIRIDYNDRDYFRAAGQTGGTVISDVLTAKSTGRPGIVIAEPIYAENQQLLGILIANVALPRLIEHMEQTRIGQTGYVYLVNKEGRILLHPDPKLVERREDVSYLAPVKAVMARQTGWAEYEINNQKKLAGFSYISQTGWGLVAQQPMEEALAEVNSVKRTGILITVLAAVAAALTGLAMAGRLTKPIIHIATVARHLAAGDLNANIRVTTRDEVGQLATAFNDMVIQLKKRESELRESEAKYRSLVENINIGVYRKTGNAESFIEYANPALLRILGYASIEELSGTSVSGFYRSQGDLITLIEEVEREGYVKNRETMFCKKDGSTIWCSVTASKHYDERKKTFWVDSVVEDITLRKTAEEELRRVHAGLEQKVQERTKELTSLNEKLTAVNEELQRISLSDGLTGIANRRYFDEFLEREWLRTKRKQVPIALILLDVDFFKLYNDAYGHIAGDQCLKQIGATLKAAAERPTDLAARYGGEEFALVLPDTDLEGAKKVGERILTRVRELAISHNPSPVSEVVTVTLGAAAFVPVENLMPNDLISAADQALYQAKQAGRNQMKTAPGTGENQPM